ncbi:hypothetical protein ACO0K2_04300 [Undibacterium sp. MH2W]|uniref:hypothetical protein n=1 Tax=Undibacterium sp. MH2W TaxID=3413044 RepID=UPI003BF35383
MAFADISIRSNIKEIQKKLSAFAQQQVPFATSNALTAIAKNVQAAEKAALPRVFDRPTPFTINSIRVRAARKNNLEAIVYVNDIAASYLAPYEFGGLQKLNSKALLNPKNVQENQYGNIPRRLIAQLKNRSDIFIGPVKTKKGEVINGVWQRPIIRVDTKFRGRTEVAKGSNTTGRLKLLIRFGDAQPVKKHLGYRTRAQKVVNTTFKAEFGKALAKAMASAR